MARYSNTAVDQYGRPIADASVLVSDSATKSAAVLTADGGGAMDNPFVTDDGAVVFNVGDGVYDIIYSRGGRIVREDFGLPVGMATVPGAVADSLGTGTAVAPSQRAIGAALAAKPDRYPAQPHLPLATGLPRVMAGWYRHFFDATNNRIRPTDGSGGANNGLPDTATTPSSWQAVLGFRTLYWQWRLYKLVGDTANMAVVAAQMQGQWTYYQSKYSVSNIKSGLGGIVNASDDASLHAQFLAHVHEVLGDANALAYLIEFIPSNCARFHDVNQTRIDYGVTTPGGIAFKSDPFGLTYLLPTSTGAFNTTQELATADGAFYVSQQGSVAAPLRAAFLSYAQNTWQWCYTLARASAGAYGTVAVTPAPAIYFASVDLDPAVATYKKGSRFGGNIDAPVRGQSAYADGMTLMMAALSLKLYRATGTTAYLTEAQAIVTSYMLPNGFVRTSNGGVPLIANARDPWVNGSYVPEYIFADFFGGTTASGVALTGAAGLPLAEAIYNSGQAISSAMADGYGTPDWVGDEYCPLTGYSRWTDEGGAGGQGSDPNQDYGGSSGGGQATPRQLMTASTITCVVQAARAIEPYIQARGSGIADAQGIERIPARLAALEVAVSQMMPRSGGFFSDKFGLDTQFYLNRNGNPYINWASGWQSYFDRVGGKYVWSAPGSDIFQAGLGNVKFLDTTYFNTRLSSTFYASYGDGPLLNFDATSYLALSVLRTRYELTLGSLLCLTVDGNANLVSYGNILPGADNNRNLGSATKRFSVVYAASSTINTSDLRDKQVRGPLNSAELAAARDIAASAVVFQYRDAVADKGAAARLHAGFIAQNIFEIFTKHGLDPARYGACCYDEWQAEAGYSAVAAVEAREVVLDENGMIVTPAVQPAPFRPAIPAQAAGNRYSLRYEELFAFIAAAQEQRLAALESKA